MNVQERRVAQEQARNIINGRVEAIRAAGGVIKWAEAFQIADALMNSAHRNTIKHLLADLVMTRTHREDYHAKQQALEASKARAAEQRAAREKVAAAEAEAAKTAEPAPEPVKEEPKKTKRWWKLWK